MWSKVAKLASPAPRKPSSTSPLPPKGEQLVLQLVDSLRLALSSPSSTSRDDRSPSEKVTQLLEELLRALKAEQASGEGAASPLGACAEVLLRDAVLAELVELVQGDEPRGVREGLVRWFGRAIVELDEAWLGHSAVNKPLIKLLKTCVDEEGGLMRQEELAVVEVMCVVAERIKTRPELLAIFFREKPASQGRKEPSSPALRPIPLTTISSSFVDDRPPSPTFSHASTSEASAPFAHSQTSSAASPRRRADRDFLLFSYLLRFIHREGQVGDFAREGVLSLVDVAFGYPNRYSPSFAPSSSPSNPPTSGLITPPSPSNAAAREAVLAFAEYLLDSDFAEVLGAGLGALYGLLPSKLVIRTGSATGQAVPQNGEIANGGMVLGGMGALHAEEEAEALERKREEEDDRLRAGGYGLSGSEEFREGLDGFLKLVEFTQDILRRSTESVLLTREGGGDGDVDDTEAESERQQRLIMNSLTAAVLGAVRNLFLQSVLYPSILECSEVDGSAVAVMSYLEAILGVVQEGTKLEGAVLAFLMAEDGDADPPSQPRPRPSNASTSSSPANNLLALPSSSSQVKQRKSSALLLIERSAPTHDSSDYFTSLGRFSLRDLLLSHLHSPSQPTSTAALKLLQVMLTQHDRWSLALLDVALDDGATSFPIALREAPDLELDDDDESDDEFRYRMTAQRDDSSDDDDEFVYPSSTSPSTPRAKPTAFTHTPARAHRRLLGTPLPSTPSVTLHLDSLDTLLSLVGTIDPSYRRLRAMGGGSGSEMLTTGFANYLRDAEATLANDAGFRRGLANPPTTYEENERPHPRRRRSALFGSAVALGGRDFAQAKSGYRHKLRPTAKLVALLLESLAAFFSHTPDVNLSLTAVLAALATYPFRSLEGWLLPVVRSPRGELGDDGLPRRDAEQYGSPRSSDGDDRSVDFEVDEHSRHNALLSPLPAPRSSSSLFGFSPSKSDAPSSATRAALPSSNSLLSILDALAKSVEQYRRTIPEFDKYLAERRQGLFFAENLADALQADEGGGGGILEENAFGPPPASAPLPPPVPAPTVLPPKKSGGGGLGLGSFFSPRRPTHGRSPSSPVNAFSTPTKGASSAPNLPFKLRRSASNDSLALPSSPTLGSNGAAASLAPPTTTGVKDGPASPFAAHYRKTGGITVTPIVVGTPSSLRSRVGADEEEEDGDEGLPDGLDSPTKRLSSARPSRKTSPSRLSSSTSSSLPTSQGKPSVPPSSPPTVSLSTILDNVIVLEEFVKELAAIVYVRRAVGIDAVRFV